MKYGEYIFIKSNKYFISKDYLQSLKFIDYEKKLIIKIYKWNPYIHHQNISFCTIHYIYDFSM